MPEFRQSDTTRTPEALEKLIRKGRIPDPIVAFFAGMAEKDRRALAPASMKIARDLTRDNDLLRVNPALLDDDWGWSPTVPALLATATLSELKRLGNRAIPTGWRPGADACVQILLDRRPPWLDRWCEWLIDRSALHWPIVRRLVREAPCDPPKSPNYVLGMIAGLAWTPSEHPILDGLLSDRELLDDLVWRLFEVEGTGELRLSRSIGSFDSSGGWAYALRQLSALGELDRGRLLDASLAALARDLDQDQTGWFARFHDYMEPSMEERAARVDSYLGCVASPISTASGMAIRSLKALHKAGKLDANLFLEQIEPALYTPTKSNAKPLLQILADIAKRDGAACRRAVLLAAILLEHPDAEIQKSALDLLERSGDPGDEAMREAVAQRLSVMVPSMRNRAAGWLGLTGSIGSPHSVGDSADIEELIYSANALPTSLAAWFGVDSALQELRAPRGKLPAIRSYPPRGRLRLAAVLFRQATKEMLELLLWTLLGLVFSPLLGLGLSLYLVSRILFWIHDRTHGAGAEHRKPTRKPYQAPYRRMLAETLFGNASGWNRVRLLLMRRPAYAREIAWSSKYVDRSGSGGQRIPLGYELAREPGIPFTPVGALMVCLDLQLSDAGDRQLATDLLIETIEAGKLDDAMMGDAITTLIDHGAFRPRRMAPCLTDAAQTSPLHAQTLLLALERALPRIAVMPRDTHLPLELLYELCVETKETVTDPDCRAVLEAIDGTGRAAKAAQRLLVLESGDPLPHRRAAAAIALAGRLEQAERWVARRAESA